MAEIRSACVPHPESHSCACGKISSRSFSLSVRSPMLSEFAETEFPPRTYGSYTLPAGQYQSLILTLGAGEGQNWWCLMYPALCIPSAAASETAALPEESESLAREPQRYEIRLKCVDLCRAAGRWLGQRLEEARHSEWFRAFRRAFG